MLPCGIFYSSNKPLMNMYLRPIVDDLLLLFREGKQIRFAGTPCILCMCAL